MINYDTRSLAEGDGVITEVEFDFLVTKKSDVLLAIVESGQDTIFFRGDDTTYLDDLTFDSVEGGGTATLKTALAAGKTVYLDLDVQEPDQPNMYRVVNNYLATFRSIERALDYIVTQVQTLSRWKEQSVRLPRHVTNFDPIIPDDVPGNGDCTIVQKTDGTGWKLGPSVVDLTTWYNGAVASAAAAAASAAAALASQVAAAASAAAALASQVAAYAHELNAMAYKDNAEYYMNQAQNWAATSQGHATNAQNYADNADTRANDAETARDDAQAAAAAAATSETNAETAETNAAASATAANGSAVAAAASAAAAAISEANAAAAAGAAATTVVGSRAAPTNVVGANGVLFTSVTSHTINWIQGSGGAVVLSHATANIQAGTIAGQRLTLIGRSDANTVQLGDGAGVDVAGMTHLFKAGSIRTFIWDGTVWTLEGSNNV